MDATTIFCIAILIVAVLYFFIILLINTGIFRLTSPPHSLTPSLPHSLTVLIPARNEEANITNCLSDIYNQDYPQNLIEVVVINDHSTDRTEALVAEFAGAHPGMSLKVIPNVTMGNDMAFKKHAIRSGVNASSGQLIITTDADTRSGPGWISSFAAMYDNLHPKMIIGPVVFHDENSFFERLQGMEFSGLMAVTAGSCSMGFPLMCNGANLAFERQAYRETLDSDDDLRFPSGDDLFLMMKIRKKFGAGSVRYLFDKEARVYTRARPTLQEFFSQRLRWVSKSRGYTDPVVLAVSVITWLFNFLLFSSIAAGVFNLQLLYFSLILLGIKMILELPAVLRMLSFSGKLKLWYLYPLTQLLNIVYVTLVGLLGNLVSYEWKGRRVSRGNRDPRG
jgi:cellulose synthase/poly-beta-1,6-N-acetylglucosamine synthase-like glycosyltransferase